MSKTATYLHYLQQEIQTAGTHFSLNGAFMQQVIDKAKHNDSEAKLHDRITEVLRHLKMGAFDTISVSRTDMNVLEHPSGESFSLMGSSQFAKGIGPLAAQLHFFMSISEDEYYYDLLILPWDVQKGALLELPTWKVNQTWDKLPGHLDFSPDKLAEGRQESFLKEMTFENCQFLYSSCDFAFQKARNELAGTTIWRHSLPSPPALGSLSLDNLRPGLNFRGEVTAAGDFWQAARDIWPDSQLPHFSFDGAMHTGWDDYPVLEIGHTFDKDSQGNFPEFSLGTKNGLHVGLAQIRISSGLTASLQEPLMMKFQAEIRRTTSSGKEIRVELWMLIPIGGKQFLLRTFEQNHEGLTIRDLEDLLGLDELAPHFPDNPVFDNLTLSEMRIGVDFSDGVKLSELSVQLQTKDPWTVIPDFVEFQPTMTFSRKYVGSEVENELSFAADWLLGETYYKTFAEYPSGNFFARMAEGESLDIAPIFHKILPRTEIPEVNLIDLELSGNFKNKEFHLLVESGSEWLLDFGKEKVRVTDVEIEADYLSFEHRFSGKISGTFNMGGWVASISAQMADQLEFEVTLPEVNISTLANDFLHAIHLPGELGDFVVKNMDFRLIPSTGYFHLEGGSDTELQIYEGFTFRMDHFLVERNPLEGKHAKYEAQLRLALELSGHKLIASATYSHDSSKGAAPTNWDFVLEESGRPIHLVTLIRGLEKMMGLEYPLPVHEINLQSLYAAFNLGEGERYFTLAGDFEVNGQTQADQFSLVAKAAVPVSNEKRVWNYAFSLGIGLDVDLKDLPFVGRRVMEVEGMRIHRLACTLANRDMSPEASSTLLQKLPNTAVYPAVEAIKKGANFSAELQMGDSPLPLKVPLEPGKVQDPDDPLPPGPNAQPPAQVAVDDTRWFGIHKQLANVSLERIGLRVRHALVSFLIDGQLDLGPLKLGMLGLGLNSPLDHFDPQFTLDGLSLEFQKGPLQIGGGLLRSEVSYEGKTVEEFDGLAKLKMESLGLTAMGAYAKIEGKPSVFVYGFMNGDLGGPAFAYVKGLSLGFGYNRSLQVPPLAQVPNFPLLQEAKEGSGESLPGPAGSAKSASGIIGNELRALSQYIRPDLGEWFGVAGLSVSSFNQIDSTLLLIVSGGKELEIDLLGLASLRLPKSVEGEADLPPLADAELAIRARYVPAKGTVEVLGQLTRGSYILARNCHLQGGYAFAAWFKGEQQGDFVNTLGGYHPDYHIPTHYPRVPRLGFRWRVSDHLRISGLGYYALLPSVLMAGANLEVSLSEGPLRAWLQLGADFLIGWKPYHYEAHAHVDIGVSYTFEVHLLMITIRKTLGAHVGADLHLWGPEFSGQAHVDLHVVSFDIRFGAQASQQGSPLNWDRFQRSFLPEPAKVCTHQVSEGLQRKVKQEDKVWTILDPHGFELQLFSPVPVAALQIQEREKVYALSGFDRPGIAPMDIRAADNESRFQLTVKRDAEVLTEIEDHFVVEPVLKSQPLALWGNHFKAPLNGPGMLDQGAVGICLKPILSQGSPTHILSRKDMLAEGRPLSAASPAEALQINVQAASEEVRRQVIEGSEAATLSNRKSLLQQLGKDFDMDADTDMTDRFVIAPQIQLKQTP